MFKGFSFVVFYACLVVGWVIAVPLLMVGFSTHWVWKKVAA